MIIKTPRFLDLELTNDCNLRCKYCYHFSSAGDVEQGLSTAEWLSFFDELGQCGIMSVSLSGGEPLMRSDFKQLVDGVVRNRMRYSVVTNGILINDKIVAILSSSSRCEMVYVSLDGSNSTTHDDCRGKGSFIKAVKGLKLIKEANLPVSVRITVHKNNFHELHRIAEFTLDELGVHYFSANMASYMGLCRENAEDVILNTAERSQAINSLFQIKQKYGEKVKNFGLVSDTNSWIKMQSALNDHNQSLDGGCLAGCGGVLDTIAVRADGMVTPCVQLNHIILGRINQDKLSDIWQNHPALQKIRTRRDISLSSFEFCNSCEYLSYCKGGCPGLTYSVMGVEHHPSPDTCLRKYLADGGRLPNAQTAN